MSRSDNKEKDSMAGLTDEESGDFCGEDSMVFGSEDPDSSSSHGADDKKEEEVHVILAQKETRAVNLLRAATILVLLATAAAVAAASYIYTHRVEVNEFQQTFYQHSTQITNTIQISVQHKLESVGAIALQLQEYAINMNLTWPFVTMPFFEETIMATKSLTDSYGVMFFPIVTKEDREEWERYSIDNMHWINESYYAQQQVYGYDGLTSELGPIEAPVDWFDLLWGPDFLQADNPDFSHGISNTIFKTRNTDDPENNFNPNIDTTPGPYFPQWQTAPLDWYYQSTGKIAS